MVKIIKNNENYLTLGRYPISDDEDDKSVGETYQGIGVIRFN